MPDWEELVRTKLAGLAIEPEERREVIVELATHLEEAHQALLTEGSSEQDAAERVLSQVSDWNDLRSRIHAARTKESIMTNRVSQLWFPGLLTFAVSMGLQALVYSFGPKPLMLSLDRGTLVLVFSTPWLLMLPLTGALGGYLSSRADGSRGTVLLASVFPVLALTAAFLLMFPIGLIIERITGSQGDFSIVATVLLRDGIGWILIPGAALLAGGLPIQFFLSRRLTSRRIVSS